METLLKDLQIDEVSSVSRGAGEGVQIGGISGRAAAGAGLQQGDVILMVNQQRIGSAAAFQAATKGLKPGDTVLLLVRRRGAMCACSSDISCDSGNCEG